MPGRLVISAWDWAAFVAAVLFFLALDLGVFHRKARTIRFREAAIWTGIWILLAVAFGFYVAPRMVENWSQVERTEFITGYIIELSLSMDNVFVIALIFAYFKVPLQFQHRVLFWGILGALLMRGVMIGLGTALINRFQWMLYVLGALLLFTGIKMIFTEDDEVDPEKNIFIRLTRKVFPVSSEFDGQKFTTQFNGRMAITPLALVLVMVETTDLMFAIDSIPAIFGVTTNSFIVFTSNVFAILGLRSLYFVLAGAIDFFRFLKIGLSIVLCFIGVKMLINHWYHIETPLSLLVVGTIILTSIFFSVIAAQREKRVARRKDKK
jgi:tellurite resistance protein TerC